MRLDCCELKLGGRLERRTAPPRTRSWKMRLDGDRNTYVGALSSDEQVEHGQPVASGCAGLEHSLSHLLHLLLFLVLRAHLRRDVRLSLLHFQLRANCSSPIIRLAPGRWWDCQKDRSSKRRNSRGRANGGHGRPAAHSGRPGRGGHDHACCNQKTPQHVDLSIRMAWSMERHESLQGTSLPQCLRSESEVEVDSLFMGKRSVEAGKAF